MLSWFKQLRFAFGASFLWLVCLIYFTQGFRSFVWTSVSYQLKDNLKLSPSTAQFVTSIAFFPWSIKPLYGILSDCIPIRGRKRIPYLILSTVLTLLTWLALGLSASLRNSRVELMILLTAQNLGSAMADVVIDAMIAEAARLERASFAGDLQSISWISMAVGGICGSLLGGYALMNLKIDRIFLLFSVLPSIQLLSCILVEENPVDGKVMADRLPSNGSRHVVNGSGLEEEDDFLSVKSKSMTSRRNKGHKKTPSSRSKHGGVPVKDGSSLAVGWLRRLKLASYTLFTAFCQPIILRSMAWFFLAQVTVPNLSTIMFYYQSEVLDLDASFLGTARVVGWSGLMIGTFFYNHFLKRMKLRRILMCAHIGLAISSLLDIALVSRLNVPLGIPDKVMVLFGSALADGINQFKFMPFLILSGQLCPPGIEGTLFALFMSINNLGSTGGSFVGAGLTSVLKISSGSFGNLSFGIAIQVLSNFIPVAFLFLIPKEATGISA